MSRALTLGNGSLLINIDQRAQVRDIFFPHVGLENHVGGSLVHRVGVFVDDQISWTHEAGWEISITMAEETLSSKIEAISQSLQVKLIFTDLVYNEDNIFIRRVIIHNLADRPRTIKLYFNQEFEMYQSHMAHTAYFNPDRHAIIHYRNQRVFLINAYLEGVPFDEYSTGVFNSEGKVGTHLDALDGKLSLNSIEHGRADSLICLTGEYQAVESKVVHYWLTVAQSIDQVIVLDKYVLNTGVNHIIESTQNFWRAWVNRRDFTFYGLAPEVVKLFKQSLLITRSHADHDGGIIASSDFTIFHYGKDTYNYVWPRDASFIAMSLTRAGDSTVAKNFFTFCNQVVSSEGYLMHKYGPDKSLGSSWHPWVRNGRPELPIQEDETALVLISLWQYYELSKDLEFIESIYNSFIKKTADFMVTYRDSYTGLPRPSYDLWEEKFGISTFTASSVYGALIAASNFAKVLGKIKNEQLYEKTAMEMKEAILKYLYNKTEGIFYKMINFLPDEIVCDVTLDISSAYGLYTFGVLPPRDERIRRMIESVEKTLRLPPPFGGIARYQNDNYLRTDPNLVGNPWFVTTLWLTQYYIRIATNERDLDRVRQDLVWVARHAQSSGILSEQLDPRNGSQLSVAPLIWSHSEFVLTVIAYLDKLEELGICPICNPVY